MERSTISETIVANDSNSSGVSWGAVIAGAFVAAALWLELLALGAGIGLSSASPWANAGATASMIGGTAIIWMVLMQFVASSTGGYLAGRLRTKWVSVHSHEVYFRDTAHGFLVWAVGLVIAAVFLASAASTLAGGTARASAAGASASQADPSRAGFGPNGYFVDTLLRTGASTSGQDDASLRGEIGLILANGLSSGSLPPADKSYLAHVVAAKTGVSQPDAESRVDEVFASAQQSADSVRKAAAHSMYWTFLALLIGAFCASFAATVGGKQRDHIMAV